MDQSRISIREIRRPLYVGQNDAAKILVSICKILLKVKGLQLFTKLNFHEMTPHI